MPKGTDYRQRMLDMADQTGPGTNEQAAVGRLQNAPSIAPVQGYGLDPDKAMQLAKFGQDTQQQANTIQQQAVKQATRLDERGFERLSTVNDMLRKERADALTAAAQGLQMKLAMSREGREQESHAMDMEKAGLVRDQLVSKIGQEKLASSIMVNVPVQQADGSVRKSPMPAGVAKAAGLDVDTMYKQQAAEDLHFRTRIEPFTSKGISPSGAAMLGDDKEGFFATYDKASKELLSKARATGGKDTTSQRAWAIAMQKFDPFLSAGDKAALKKLTSGGGGGGGPEATKQLANDLANALKQGVTKK